MYGPVKIIIDALNVDPEQAKFNRNLVSSAPNNAVMIGREGRFYNAAASLDWVVHEWGHGVIFTSANFPYSGVGAELHEGFADVIGHMVERNYHPLAAGNAPVHDQLEKADRVMHEDAAVSGCARGAVDDDGGHDWTGPNFFNGDYTSHDNNLLHVSDVPQPSDRSS